MSDALIAAGISFGWPALSLFEMADKRNIAGGLAAWVAAFYLRETPLMAYGAGAAIFGVSTYYVAKKNKYVQEVIAFRGAKQSKKISDVGLLAMYVGSNKVLASFVTVFVAVSKSTATDQSN